MTSIAQARCSKCGEIKPVSEFHKGRNPGGVQSYCKACKNTGPRTYFPTFGPRNDITGQRNGTWTVVRWIGKGRWAVRCDCGSERVIEYNEWLRGDGIRRCPCTKRPTYNQLPPGEAGFNALWQHYNRQKGDRGIAFELTREQFRMLVTMDCAYCGTEPAQVKRTGSGDEFTYNGIDRIDPSKGYTWDNCNPCCKYCNFAKNNFPLDVWLDHIKRIYHHMGLDNL